MLRRQRGARCLVFFLAMQMALPSPLLAEGYIWSALDGMADRIFRTRKADIPPDDPMLCLARSVTCLEDSIRRDGSITIKQPDVWGDANLMQFIQEYETQMKRLGVRDEFKQTLQAMIARSDQMEFQATTALGIASGNRNTINNDKPSTTVIPVPNVAVAGATVEGQGTTPGTVTATPIDIKEVDLYSLLTKSAATSGVGELKVGVEPTEFERQFGTYLSVNHALRRRNMGDDNSRMPGYGLFLFRVPVSVLPGRETYRGHSAVVTLRAQLQLEATHLRKTFPKLAIADAVDALAPVLSAEWDRKLSDCYVEECCEGSHSQTPPSSNWQSLEAPDQQFQREDKGLPTTENISTPEVVAGFAGIYGEATIEGILRRARFELGKDKPKHAELRAFLFRYFMSLQVGLERRGVYDHPGMQCLLVNVGKMLNAGATLPGLCQKDRCGDEQTLTKLRKCWIDYVKECLPADACLAGACMTPNCFPDPVGLDLSTAAATWVLAVHAAELDANLKLLLRDLADNGRIPPDHGALLEQVFFFSPGRCEGVGPTTAAARMLWEELVRLSFPLYVFALDPQVEEQNVWDAFSMRREMQLALAIGVARSNFNMAQRVALSRQLGLDQAGIDLNRTAVAFTHGAETFGWYFYPRVQAPPPEENNLAALTRLIWKGGPGRCYDLNHRELEPGIRECEVILVMPGFVSGVKFDVTTNWELLAKPGTTLRSYEEMLVQGRQVMATRRQAFAGGDTGCYRPGDYERLVSRVDQLEQMLGMQTYETRVPYEYELAGRDLFDLGDTQLRPVIHDFYGLEYLKDGAGLAASFFLTGKNFHPIQTHAIVGGTEIHTTETEIAANGVPVTQTDVEVISRELIHVRVRSLVPELSRVVGGVPQFQVRVGTPAGISNGLTIDGKAAKAPEQGFVWANTGPFPATFQCCEGSIDVDLSCLGPLSLKYSGAPPIDLRAVGDADVAIELKGTAEGETAAAFRVYTGEIDASISNGIITLDPREARSKIEQAIESLPWIDPAKKWGFTGTAHLRFGAHMPLHTSISPPIKLVLTVANKETTPCCEEKTSSVERLPDPLVVGPAQPLGR
ncbi:MAG: hypothetical protein KF708_08350 [Pirellulales bacterium]|nr:hypothetical protein [Pirellulales bacterium]